MFGNTAERRVVRDADRIVSLKEDMDALSWSRVLELGKHLQDNEESSDDCVDCARELVTIAQSNLSLYARLGIDPDPIPSHIMASGVEVLEGGMAEAALEKHEGCVAEELPAPEEPNERDFEEAAATTRATAPLFKRIEIVATPKPVPEPEPVAATLPVPEVVTVAEPEPEPEPAPDPAPAKTSPVEKRGRFSRFKNLYESRDGGLCLFEDEHGHLVAVDASKLA